MKPNGEGVIKGRGNYRNEGTRSCSQHAMPSKSRKSKLKYLNLKFKIKTAHLIV